ncbi:MAG: hypothetical protein ACK5NC_15790 [Vibrio sp.]
MIFFGEQSSELLSLLTVAGHVVGAKQLETEVLFKAKTLSSLHLTQTESPQLEMQAFNPATGQLIEMKDNAATILAYTHEPKLQVIEQADAIATQRQEYNRQVIQSIWFPTSKDTPTV